MTFHEQFHRIGKDGKKYWGKMGAGIIFTDGEQILLLKRSDNSDYAAYWSIPGGKAKKDELPLDCARRESKEECGYNNGQRFAHFHTKDGAHSFHTYLFSVDKPFDVKLSNEHSDFKWVPLNEVSSMKLHPAFAESWPSHLKAIRKKFVNKNSFAEWLVIRSAKDN